MASKHQSRPPQAAPVKKEEIVTQQTTTPDAGATAASEAVVQQTNTGAESIQASISEAPPVETSTTLVSEAAPASAPVQAPVAVPALALNVDAGKSGTVLKAPSASTTAPSQKPALAPETTPVSSNYTFQAKVDSLKKDGNDQTKTLIMYLEQYLIDMAPRKPMEADELVHRQQAFWKSTLFPLMEQPNEDFHQSFSILVAFFREYSEGAFHERYLFRGVENFTQAKEQTDAFLALLNLIKILSKAVDRKTALRQVDLGRTFAGVYSEDARNRIIGYLTN